MSVRLNVVRSVITNNGITDPTAFADGSVINLAINNK
jgi:hypothetical protein